MSIKYKNCLTKVLATHLGCMTIALGLALPAYGANEEDVNCPSVSRPGEANGGCVLTYDVTTPAGAVVPTGASANATGVGTITKGANSIAIGNGATVGELTPAVVAKPAVEGVFNVEIKGVTYEGVTGQIRLGSINVLILATPDTSDSDGDGDNNTVTFDSTVAGAMARVEVVTAPKPATAAAAATRMNADNAVAIGAGATVTGDNGIALGAGASAGENEIVIGRAGQSAVIGGVDLAGIATNATGIATNATGIATNATGIATNATGIATNRSGIAIAIALSHLPSVPAGDRGSWGIAAGSFGGETAIAAGITYQLEGKRQIKVGISSAGGETAGGIGFGVGF